MAKYKCFAIVSFAKTGTDPLYHACPLCTTFPYVAVLNILILSKQCEHSGIQVGKVIPNVIHTKRILSSVKKRSDWITQGSIRTIAKSMGISKSSLQNSIYTED